MERTQIDHRDLGLRARRRASRAAADADADAPLQYTAGGGADVDEDVLDRIDALLDEIGGQSRPTADPTAI